MPATLIIQARPLGDATPRRPMGAALHAEFLSLIKRLDSTYATWLHDGQGLKPYTLSSLLPCEEGYVWRWTALDERMREAMLAAANELPAWLAPAGFRVGLRWERTHPDALVEPYERLVERPGRVVEVHLQFRSPTTFRNDGHDLPLPVPRLILASWAERWNAHAGIPMPVDLVDGLVPHLHLRRAEVRTTNERIGKVSVTGFMGRATLGLDVQAPPTLAAGFGWLVAFASYGGTGSKTTMGYGQTLVSPLRVTARAATRLATPPPASVALDWLPPPPPVVPVG